MIYANDNDRRVCEWMRHLPLRIDRIDDRSIADVKGSDLDGFTQCHFFAGIAGWPLALEMAGWPTDAAVWTGSVPCQPYSAAGKRKGHTDERDLWPEFYRLIAECRPPVVFGEQVASAEVVGTQLEAAFVAAVREGEHARANKLAKRLVAKRGFHSHKRWLSRVRSDLEAAGYSVRFIILGAHSAGAPHIRQRLYWVAYTKGEGQQGRELAGASDKEAGERTRLFGPDRHGPACGLGDAAGDDQRRAPVAGRDGEWIAAGGPSGDCGVDDANGQRRRTVRNGHHAGYDRKQHATTSGNDRLEHAASNGRIEGRPEPERRRIAVRRNESFWGDAEYIYCRDEKWRPVEPGIEPLASGIPGRVDQLRGLGNSIVPQVAAAVVRSFMESCQPTHG